MDRHDKGVSDMTKMLLAAAGSIAAIVLAAGGAQAQSFNSTHHGRFEGRIANPALACGGDRSFHGDRRGARGACATDVVMGWYGGDWAQWNNKSWEPTSYNDWWHEEPSRAYPAWMSRNQDCSRQWYSADTLRC
jgi:hypothetical protein